MDRYAIAYTALGKLALRRAVNIIQSLWQR